MRIRIIAGKFGGRFLATPNTSATHPMSERVRSAMFNWLSDELTGAYVLDAFAGSGVLGLEAISRGAAQATLIDKNRVAAKVIRESCQILQVEDSVSVVNTTVNNWLDTAVTDEFDVIFVDPPYHDPQFSTVKKLMGLLKVGGCMILSYSGRGEVPHRNGIVVVDNRSYGNAHLIYFRRES